MCTSRLKGVTAISLCINCLRHLLGVTATVANVSKPFVNYSKHRNFSDNVVLSKVVIF